MSPAQQSAEGEAESRVHRFSSPVASLLAVEALGESLGRGWAVWETELHRYILDIWFGQARRTCHLPLQLKAHSQTITSLWCHCAVSRSPEESPLWNHSPVGMAFFPFCKTWFSLGLARKGTIKNVPAQLEREAWSWGDWKETGSHKERGFILGEGVPVSLGASSPSSEISL